MEQRVQSLLNFFEDSNLLLKTGKPLPESGFCDKIVGGQYRCVIFVWLPCVLPNTCSESCRTCGHIASSILAFFGDCNSLIISLTERAQTETMANVSEFAANMQADTYLAVLQDYVFCVRHYYVWG